MAQLVEHRVVTREVVSSTPAGPAFRVLKYLRNKCYLCNYISKWLEFKVFSVNPRPRLTVPSMFKMSTWDVKEPPHHSKRVRREVPGVVAVLLSSKCGRDVLKRLAVYDATYAKTATKRNFAEC